MCIAIYSLKGTDIPSKDALLNCFIANPDGAGFAFAYNNTVHIRKGFFDFDDFYQALMACDQKYSLKDLGLLIHFRIATHGGTSAGLCHPFPLSTKESKLCATYTTSSHAIIHNGIISLCANAPKTEKLSDTALFVRDYLSQISRYKGWFSNPQTPSFIYQLIDSKMAILNSNGDIIATEEGFHEWKGNFYSNYSYLDPLPHYYGYGMWDKWDWGLTSTRKEGKTISLMQLQKGEALCYSDGTVEEYSDSYHRYFPTFLSEDSEIYTLFDDTSDSICFENLSFMGTGMIIDPRNAYSENGIRELPFRVDAAINQ